MNILFFTHHLNQGGAEKTVRSLSEYFNTHDFNIKSFICVVYDDPHLKPYPQNVIVMKNQSNEWDNRVSKGFNVLAQIHEMRQIKKKLNIDICISFLPGADIINVLSGEGEKQIVSVRNIESLFVHSILKKWYVEVAYRRCNLLIACSETVRRDCINYFRVPNKKIITIHNAATPLCVLGHVIPEFQKFHEAHHIVLNVGRLAPEKGQIHLLKAFAAFLKRYDNTNDHRSPGLVFIGDGDLSDKLREIATKLGIYEHVLFCGRQPNPADYMKSSDLFVLSSNMEGMPNVLVEALQSGLPCIATECGAREILAPNTDPIKDRTSNIETAEYGILVPICGNESTYEKASERPLTLSNNEQLLSDAIEMLYCDNKLREQYRDGAPTAVLNLSIDYICDLWIKAMKNVMRG